MLLDYLVRMCMKLVALFVKRVRLFVNKHNTFFGPCPCLLISLCVAVRKELHLPGGKQRLFLSTADGVEESLCPLHKTTLFLCVKRFFDDYVNSQICYTDFHLHYEYEYGIFQEPTTFWDIALANALI